MAQMSLFDTVQDNDIVEEIKNLDMTNLTPMEAMNILYNLQNKIKNRLVKRIFVYPEWGGNFEKNCSLRSEYNRQDRSR